MKSFHTQGDQTRLYFCNYEKRSDDDEFDELMKALTSNHCTISKANICPDCDLILCALNGVSFSVIRTIDSDGTFIHCEDSSIMNILMAMFS